MCWAAAVAVMLWLVVDVPSAAAAATESCSAVRSVYNGQGFREDVPSQPISGRWWRLTSPSAERSPYIQRVCINVPSFPSRHSRPPGAVFFPTMNVAIMHCLVPVLL